MCVFLTVALPVYIPALAAAQCSGLFTEQRLRYPRTRPSAAASAVNFVDLLLGELLSNIQRGLFHVRNNFIESDIDQGGMVW